MQYKRDCDLFIFSWSPLLHISQFSKWGEMEDDAYKNLFCSNSDTLRFSGF